MVESKFPGLCAALLDSPAGQPPDSLCAPPFAGSSVPTVPWSRTQLMGNASYSDTRLGGTLSKGLFTLKPRSGLGRGGWCQWIVVHFAQMAKRCHGQRPRRKMDQSVSGSWLPDGRIRRHWPWHSRSFPVYICHGLSSSQQRGKGRGQQHGHLPGPALSWVTRGYVHAVSTLLVVQPHDCMYPFPTVNSPGLN